MAFSDLETLKTLFGALSPWLRQWTLEVQWQKNHCLIISTQWHCVWWWNTVPILYYLNPFWYKLNEVHWHLFWGKSCSIIATSFLTQVVPLRSTVCRSFKVPIVCRAWLSSDLWNKNSPILCLVPVLQSPAAHSTILCWSVCMYMSLQQFVFDFFVRWP